MFVMEKMNIRRFLKTTGKLALVGAAAVSLTPNFKRISTAEASQEEFNVYSDINSHVKAIQSDTFSNGLSKSLKPGIYYSTSKPMVAVAEGTVVEIIDLADQSGRWELIGSDIREAEGIMVQIRHGNNFSSCYLYLQEPQVKFGQKVKRGQLIGIPDSRWNIPSLMLLEEMNAIDPDKYGVNHNYMTYWDGVSDFEIGKVEQNRRVEKQNQLLRVIADSCIGAEKYTLLMKKHKHGDRVVKWSKIDTFQYAEYAYKKNAEKFSSLKQKQFEKIKKEFYSNQPIILTLPFKKG
jgi:hypothetical protein